MEDTKKAIYLRFFVEFGLIEFVDVILFNDSVSAQKLAKNSVFHGRIKHIDIKHYFIREALKNNLISLKYLYTEDADIFTKMLSPSKHIQCTKSLRLFL